MEKFSDWTKTQGQLRATYKETTWNIKTQVKSKNTGKDTLPHVKESYVNITPRRFQDEEFTRIESNIS